MRLYCSSEMLASWFQRNFVKFFYSESIDAINDPLGLATLAGRYAIHRSKNTKV